LQWLCSTIGILSLVPFFNPRTGCSRLLKITEYFFLFVFKFILFFEFEGLLVNLMLCSCQRPQGSRNLASHVLKVTLSRLLWYWYTVDNIVRLFDCITLICTCISEKLKYLFDWPIWYLRMFMFCLYRSTYFNTCILKKSLRLDKRPTYKR
jgi:hypothetical protein